MHTFSGYCKFKTSYTSLRLDLYIVVKINLELILVIIQAGYLFVELGIFLSSSLLINLKFLLIIFFLFGLDRFISCI